MIRRIALLAALLGIILPFLGSPAHAADRPDVVVVGIPGLQWNQVSATATPTLWRLARTGSVGALSIRSAAQRTCPRDGWLTIGAGNRVRTQGDCSTVTSVVEQPPGGRIGTYNAVVRANKGLDFGAVPGILVSSLGASSCVGAVGHNAALGAADRTGQVSYLARSVDRQTLSHCPVTLVDGGFADSTEGVASADRLVAEADASRPAGSVLIVVGLSDLATDERAHLHVSIANGGPYTAGVLVSQSTRMAPYVQLIDVAPTILALRGVSIPSSVDGQPWRRVGASPDSVASLADKDRAAGAVRGAMPWVVVAMVVVLVAGTGLSVLGRRRLAALALLTALAAPAASYLVNLAPWWRSSHSTLLVLVATLLLAGLLALPAFRVGERVSWVIAAGLVTGLTFVVLVADVVTGSRLQMDSVLGYSPLVAGRFTGLGNVAFAVFAAAAVLTATSLAVKAPGRGGVLAPAAVGLVAVVADGAPPWGSDVGGVLSLVPGFGLLVLLCAGARVSWQRLVAVGAGGVALVTAFALADYARPADRQTHLGRFIGRVLHGDAGGILRRKWHADVDLLLANAATLLVPLVIAGALWCMLRPRPRLARAYARHPQLRFGLLALAVVSLIGLVVNDSGVAIPALAVMVGLPYVLVVLTGDTPGEPVPEPPSVLP